MRPSIRYVSIVAIWIWGMNTAFAQSLPSDVGVEVVASSEVASPGQPFSITMSVTNHGAVPVELVYFASNELRDAYLDLPNVNPTCVLLTSVGDGTEGVFYYFTWMVGMFGEGPLKPGERRQCSFTTALTTDAPPQVVIAFEMTFNFSDSDPNNDRAAVTVRRGDPVPVLVSTNSTAAMTLLAVFLTFVAGLGLRFGNARRPR